MEEICNIFHCFWKFLTEPSSFDFSLSSDLEETKDDVCSLEVKKDISKLKSGKINGPDLILK
jgi:hypothetical protein